MPCLLSPVSGILSHVAFVLSPASCLLSNVHWIPSPIYCLVSLSSCLVSPVFCILFLYPVFPCLLSLASCFLFRSLFNVSYLFSPIPYFLSLRLGNGQHPESTALTPYSSRSQPRLQPHAKLSPSERYVTFTVLGQSVTFQGKAT